MHNSKFSCCRLAVPLNRLAALLNQIHCAVKLTYQALLFAFRPACLAMKLRYAVTLACHQAPWSPHSTAADKVVIALRPQPYHARNRPPPVSNTAPSRLEYETTLACFLPAEALDCCLTQILIGVQYRFVVKSEKTHLSLSTAMQSELQERKNRHF